MTMAKKKALKASIKSARSRKSDLPVDLGMSIRDPRVLIVIDFIKANLHRKISLTDLAREVNLSAAHVSRLFSIETGIPPSEYLIRLRMEKARHLLLTSLLSVKEIMAMTGYGNRGHFLQHFKRYFGLTPSEYRRRVSRS